MYKIHNASPRTSSVVTYPSSKSKSSYHWGGQRGGQRVRVSDCSKKVAGLAHPARRALTMPADNSAISPRKEGS